MEQKLRMEFVQESFETWENSVNGFYGKVTLNKFEDTFRVLVNGTDVDGAKIYHPSYKDWSWLRKKCSSDYFGALNNALNDDCIREITKYLDLLHLVYLGEQNKRFNAISEEAMKKLWVHPSTVGQIGTINLRYLLYLSEDTLEELSISIHSFPTVFGIHSNEMKNDLLKTIIFFAGNKLKKVRLNGFRFGENIKWLRHVLHHRGVQVEEEQEIEGNFNFSMNHAEKFSLALRKNIVNSLFE